MDNEFDFEDDDFGFEQEDPGFEVGTDFDSDDFEDYEDDEIEMDIRTVVLSKNNMVGLLCMKTSVEGGAICRVDPRENNPSVQIYDNPDAAVEWFNKSLNSSRKNGWKLVYDGLPLMG